MKYLKTNLVLFVVSAAVVLLLGLSFSLQSDFKFVCWVTKERSYPGVGVGGVSLKKEEGESKLTRSYMLVSILFD